MNSRPNETVTLAFTGTLTLNRKVLVELLRDAVAEVSLPVRVEAKSVATVEPIGKKSSRVAFGTGETCEMLGVSRATLWRLIQRGLIRTCGGLGRPLIQRAEIERYLKETTR